MAVHPVLLSAVLADLVSAGRDEAARRHGFGVGSLIGRLPHDVSPPQAVTRLGLMRTPRGVEDLGLDLDMVCWPLKRKLLSMRSSTFQLGRDQSNDIVIPHVDVGRHHLVLTVFEDAVTAEDAGSTNGTRLLRKEPPGLSPWKLQDRDRLAMGGMELTYLGTATLFALLGGGT